MFSMANDMDLCEKREEVVDAQKNLLKRMNGSEELEISRWTLCTDVSLLQFVPS